MNSYDWQKFTVSLNRKKYSTGGWGDSVRITQKYQLNFNIDKSDLNFIFAPLHLNLQSNLCILSVNRILAKQINHFIIISDFQFV